MDFSKLVKKKTSAKLAQRIKESQQNKYDDPNAWSYTLDKKGMASCVIRFLPTSEADMEYQKKLGVDEDAYEPWVERFDHGFKVGSKWYINICPTTYTNEDDCCPVCSDNSRLIDETGMSFQDLPDSHPTKLLIRERKRKQSYYANVLIIEDKEVPENNGKVKVWRFGYEVYKQILDKLIPKFDDEESVDVTHWTEGCNYRMKVYKDNGQITYKRCTFDSPSPLAKTTAKMKEIWEQCQPLHKYIDESVHVPFDKLQERFNKVTGTASKIKTEEKDVGNNTPNNPPVNESPQSDDDIPFEPDAPDNDNDSDVDDELRKKLLGQ